MPTFQVNEQSLTSLAGHLLFGFVLGAVYVAADEATSAESVPDRTRTA